MTERELIAKHHFFVAYAVKDGVAWTTVEDCICIIEKTRIHFSEDNEEKVKRLSAEIDFRAFSIKKKHCENT